MADLIRVESIAQAHEMFQIGKPKHPLVTVIYHNTPHMNRDYGDFRYAIDLYQIALKDLHKGQFGYGRSSYDFEEGVMVFTGPGQVLTAGKVDYKPESKGWVLFFHPDLIRKSHLGTHIHEYNFFSYEVNEALHLSDEEKNSLTALVKQIDKELNQNLDKHSQKLIISNIELLLDYCTRYYDRQFLTRTNLNKDIVIQLDRLLRSYYQSDQPLEKGVPTVAFCGEQLHLSPKYLSDLLKKETGNNAQQHIQKFLINKAKTQLLGTGDPISQIAYSLGFEYPQHFSKLFKNKTGMSPAEYRSLN
ncbi:MAG: helix-turn-helix domain-containing protein [Bacteroidota bacterium]